jgi:hypothetical protein
MTGKKYKQTKPPKQRGKKNKGEGIDPIDFLETKFLFPGEGGACMTYESLSTPL